LISAQVVPSGEPNAGVRDPCFDKVIKTTNLAPTLRPTDINFYVNCDSSLTYEATSYSDGKQPREFAGYDKQQQVCYSTEIGPTAGTAAERPDDVYACCTTSGKSGKMACLELEVNANKNAIIECRTPTSVKGGGDDADDGKHACVGAKFTAATGDIKLDCDSGPDSGIDACPSVQVKAPLGNVYLKCSEEHACGRPSKEIKASKVQTALGVTATAYPTSSPALAIIEAVNVEIECSGSDAPCGESGGWLTATYSGTCTCTETTGGNCPPQSSFNPTSSPASPCNLP